MNTKLFVGNISFNTTENDLQDAFAAHGTVTEANLMVDRMSGRPRGFGFVTMSTPEEAEKGIVVCKHRGVPFLFWSCDEAAANLVPSAADFDHFVFAEHGCAVSGVATHTASADTVERVDDVEHLAERHVVDRDEVGDLTAL